MLDFTPVILLNTPAELLSDSLFTASFSELSPQPPNNKAVEKASINILHRQVKIRWTITK